MEPNGLNDDYFAERTKKRKQVAAAVSVIITAAAQNLQEVTTSLVEAAQRVEETRFDGRHYAVRVKKRTQFDHKRAQDCIISDYLGIPKYGMVPRFNSRQFQVMFRIHPTRYEHIRYMIGNFGNPFFRSASTAGVGRSTASLDCRLLLSLKTLGYGVAVHCFADYFQMSQQLCRDCLIHFCRDMKQIFQEEFLRCPSAWDLKNIIAYHKAVHKVPGMIGSLDCTHTTWKNCPKAFQGSYSGKSKRPTIVLEAVCDYNLWFWHASFGYCGAMNDINILNLSPLLEQMLDGTFDRLEDEADEVTPFQIGNEQFNKCFFLTDGIYPRYARFVKGLKVPLTEEQKRFTAWQESARKDIERAFGVLKEKFQWVSCPIKLMSIEEIAERMACCLILHNISVMDRTTDGIPGGLYNPLKALTCHSPRETPANVGAPQDRSQKQGTECDAMTVGVERMPEAVLRSWVNQRADAYRGLGDREENARLQNALISTFK